MKAKLRETELYFDIESLGLVPRGAKMAEKPTAFLIHGGPGVDHSSYKPLFSNLTDLLQLVYFDHRGQGRSARGNPATYTLENNVADLEELRDYLGLEKIVLIGSSYGGMVALTYATRYPDRVQSLIVMATAASYRFLAQAKQNLAKIGTAAQIAMAEHLWQGTFKDEQHLRQYFQVMASLYSQTYDPSSAADSFQRTIFSVEAINLAFRTFLREFDLSNQLERIKSPTLVIGAREDWICPPEFSQEIAAKIPDSTLKILSNCGHLIRVDQPERLIREIRHFLT
ncbi:MAG: alpha/beta hydrolase [Crocosphaera sp.]